MAEENRIPDYWDWGFWFRHLIKGKPGFIIGGRDDPYLVRWYLVPRNPYLNVYLHKFVRSDDDRALHDHPWWFLSLILKGAYIEHRQDGTTLRSRGSIARREPTTLHRVELLPHSTLDHHEEPVWTLFLTGPKVREWGFKCPKGWIHWKEFDKNGGCGEYA